MGIIRTLRDRWRSWRMFKRIDIQLTGPICSCKQQKIEWSISLNRRLSLECLICGVALFIPYDAIGASITFDTPYPQGDEDNEPARVLQLVRHDDKEKEEEQQ